MEDIEDETPKASRDMVSGGGFAFPRRVECGIELYIRQESL